MDMNALRRQLDSFNTDLEDVNKLLLETDEASEGLVRKMKELSGIGSKGGIIRSIITRFSVAVPSLYKLTQQASSLLLIFRYIDTARTESLKEEAKVVESLKRREEIQRRLYKIEKARRSGNLTALEKEQFYNDSSIKNMMKSMSFGQALLKTQEKMSMVKNKIAKSDDKIFKAARQRFVRDNYGGNLTGGNLLGKASILMADEELKGMRKRKGGLKTQLADLADQEFALKDDIDSGYLSDSGKKQAERDLQVVQKLMTAVEKSMEIIQDDMQIAYSRRDDLIERQSGSFRIKGRAGSRKFEDLTFFEKKQLKYEELKNKINKKVDKVKDGFQSFFSKGNMKLMLQNAMKFGKVLMYALGFILVLGIVIYMLRKMRFFERAGEIFAWGKEKLIPFWEMFTENIGIFISEIIDIVVAIKDIFVGLFSGDGEKIWDAIKEIGESLWEAAKAYGKIVLSGFILTIGGLLLTLSTFIGGLIWGAASTIKDAFLNFIDNPIQTIKKGLGGAVSGAALGAVAGGIIGSVVPGAGTIAGAAIGASIGGTIGGYSGAAGMASGGTNLMGGNYLVGENGPEIVSIPGGSSVINNTNTRSAMGNTIHVHVNGRVGASEQELNQLADKIGQKISMRMNRFSPTGMRG